MGCGLFSLASRTLRWPLGYPWRKCESGWEPHPRSRELVCGVKALPWMHLGALPHALVERADARGQHRVARHGAVGGDDNVVIRRGGAVDRHLTEFPWPRSYRADLRAMFLGAPESPVYLV